MLEYPVALYDAFAEAAFGGSQAAVVLNAESIAEDRQCQIAEELGLPATCFVYDCDESSVTARFRSAVMELPMCGHGTMCMMTHLANIGVFSLEQGKTRRVILKLPVGEAVTEMSLRADGRPQILLDVRPSTFRRDDLDIEPLVLVLGLDRNDLHEELPVETAVADFIHLVMPIRSLSAMKRLTPDFSGIRDFCIASGLETVATFCLETEGFEKTLHVRDFCPAVGVPESAAAGTTNGALSCYLARHELIPLNVDGPVEIQAEQGIEIGRPSTIRSLLHLGQNGIERLQVGGVATKVMDGHIHVPNDTLSEGGQEVRQ